MTELLGLPLGDVIRILESRGIRDPEIVPIAGKHPPKAYDERVVRIREGGRELTVARFPVYGGEDPDGTWLS